MRNPEDRKEATLKHFDYEHLSDKHKAFVKAKRFVQQDQWKVEGPKVLSECEPGDVVVCSRFSDKKPFYVLVQLEELSPMPHTIDDASPYKGHVDDTDQWVRGVVVSALDPKRPHVLERTTEQIMVPVRSLRERLSDSTVQTRDAAAAADADATDSMDDTTDTTDTTEPPPTSPPTGRPSSWKVARVAAGMFAACAMLWNMALGIFRAAKPYNVRKGTRETSLCQYHLRWDFMVRT